MAPYDSLQEDEMEEEDIDFSDLNEQYEVRLESSLDAFCVIDGLPVVPEDSKPKLVKFIQRKLNQSVLHMRCIGLWLTMLEESGRSAKTLSLCL